MSMWNPHQQSVVLVAFVKLDLSLIHPPKSAFYPSNVLVPMEAKVTQMATPSPKTVIPVYVKEETGNVRLKNVLRPVRLGEVSSIKLNLHFFLTLIKNLPRFPVCRYVLAKGINEKGESFAISIQNVLCGSLGVTCSKYVQIAVSGKHTESITLSSDYDAPKLVAFKDNDVSKKMDVDKLISLKLYPAGVFTIIEAPHLGLQVKWDHGTRIYVKVGKRWHSKIQGLCGNYNGNAQDDLTTPSSGTETSPVLFGDSWKLDQTCAMPTEPINACVEHPERKFWSERKCGILKSDLFKACHSVVPVDNYLKRCVFDTCACDQGGDCGCLCTAIAAYAHSCSMKGLPIKWRTQELCREYF